MENEEFVTQCINKYKESIESYPYNINLIDELHANENAHSRILSKLLQYRDTRKQTYPILESFLKRFKIILEENNNRLKIERPKFTCEEPVKSESRNGRIDLYIEDETYAIIIENKINDAPEQKDQLSRYINDKKKNQSNIFVFYLSKNGISPTETSLNSKEREELENENRLHLVSYQQDILYWLEEEVLPYCIIKEEILASALKQYVDHLKGLFLLRSQDREVKETMKSEILKLLEIDGISDKNKIIEELFKKIEKERKKLAKHYESNGEEDYVGKIVDIMESTRTEIVYDYFSEWREKIRILIGGRQNLEIEHNFIDKDKNFGNQYPRVGIKFKYQNIDFCCIIEANLSKNDNPYIAFWTINYNKKPAIIDFLKDLKDNKYKVFDKFKINKKENTNSWFYTNKIKENYNEIYDIFENICNETIDQLNESNSN